MKLRARLAVVAAVATLPTLVALVAYDAASHRRAAEERLVGFVLARVTSGRTACEADPANWGTPSSDEPPRGGPDLPPPPPDHRPPDHRGPPKRPGHAEPAMLYAYDDAFHPGRPSAPPIPEDLRARLRTDEHVATSSTRSSRDVAVLVRTPWGTGPCAYVLARGTTDPSWGAVLPESPLWLLPIGVVLAAVLVGVGPVLRRIRRLTEAASRSASVSYANVVTASGDDEISELARAFDAAAREVRSQLQAKERREKALRDFLANTTHDVMIPLTVLQGHLATLRARAEEGPEADRAVLVSAMDEAHYMASLVHNLAMVARFDADDVILQKSDVDLNALVQRVVGRHAPIARQLGVSIESAVPEDPVIVFADVTLLEQAVSNVTYNAIRYNERNGHVAIILEALRGGAFSLRVIDDGPGVPDAAMAALTQRGMRRDEARTRVPEGQGLGLHIAHRAVELHGYRLRFDRSEYGGLEVTLQGSAP